MLSALENNIWAGSGLVCSRAGAKSAQMCLFLEGATKTCFGAGKQHLGRFRVGLQAKGPKVSKRVFSDQAPPKPVLGTGKYHLRRCWVGLQEPKVSKRVQMSLSLRIHRLAPQNLF